MDTPGRPPTGLPARLGRYAVRRRIGSGGFATVWLAYDDQLDSPVAIKVLGDIWTEDHQIRQRFVEEGRFLRKVESPHVVSVYDAGELEDGRPYLVMSYADQGTLAERLDDGGLTVAQALEVVRDVGRGLQALHDRGVLHRDVKPANVLFRTVDAGRPASGPSAPDGSEPRASRVRAMLGDLGLGKSLDVSSRLTMVAGTPSFVAPEQAAAESPGPAADQYSLAALTYLLLTGRRPFERESLADAARPVARDPVSTPERPFPDAVEVVLGRALSFAPGDRYRTVTDFVVALEAALAPTLDSDAATTVIPLDPDLTRPGPRPTPVNESRSAARAARSPAPATAVLTAVPTHHQADHPTDHQADDRADDRTRTATAGAGSGRPERRSRRRRALLVGVPLGLVALVGGGVAGWAVERSRTTEVRLTSANDLITLRVPETWDRARSTDQWRPPGAQQDYDAISVGTSTRWNDPRVAAQGAFAGLLPGRSLPPKLPQHPECDSADTPSRAGTGTGATLTAVFRGCPDGITIERVERVTNDELLWVQVRGDDQSTAKDVLGSVRWEGF